MPERGRQVMDRVTAYRLLIAEVYEVAGASRRTSEALAARHGQTAARWHVLSAISEEPRTVPAIARRLGLTRQSVQRVVNELAAESLVMTGANPDHARSPLVEVTAAGRRVLDRLFEDSRSTREALLARVGLEADQLLAAREVLRALLTGYQSTPSPAADLPE